MMSLQDCRLHPRSIWCERFEKVLSDIVTEWHRTGRIAALEEKWHIPHSPFAEEMRRKYSEPE